MPVRKVQRKRTGSRARPVAKKKWEESSSDEEESSSSSEEEQQAPKKPNAKPKAKPKAQTMQEDDNDEDSFDSNQYEFSSGEESKHKKDDDDAKDDEDFSAAYSSSSSDDDDDDESDFEKARRRVCNARGRNASTRRSNQKSRARQSGRRKNDSSSEEDFHEDNDDESEEESVVEHSEEESSDDQQVRRRASPRRKAAPKRSVAKGRAAAAAKKQKAHPRQKKTARSKNHDDDDDDDDEEEEEDSDHWGEEESSSEEEDFKGRAGTRRRAATTTARANGRKRKATKSPPSRSNRKKPESNKEESLIVESDESEFSDKKTASRSNKRRKAQTRAAPKRRRRTLKESSESEAESSNEYDTNPTTPTRRRVLSAPASSESRSRRASAKKAMSNLAVLDDDEEEDDEDLIPKSFRKHKDDEDEEFELEQGGEEQESDEGFGSVEDDDELVKDQKESGDEKVGMVDDEDIGSAEESEDEAAATTPYKAARLNLESPARITKPFALDDYDEDESSDDNDDKKQPAFSPSVPKCDSQKDAITDEDLPVKHVCYFAPDGKSKQCFALETLHKIATCAMRGQIRQTLTGSVVQTFLQPPHFRSAMSDDLLDQIASRFGRDALDLHGDFYKRQKEAGEKASGNGSKNDESDHDEPSLEASHAFVQQVQEYVRAQMGSHDLYVCPVCYLVAKRKYNITGELDYEKETEKDDDTLFAHYTEKQSDPMEVLGSLDETFSDSFVMASSFCFPTVAKVKYHLREDHHVQTKNIEGNELYASFKIRTTDGLLQRFLKKIYRGHVNQGAMQSYWFSGKNFDFVYLYSLVEQAATCRSIVARGGQGDESSQDEERQEAEVFLDKTGKFFDSFADLGQRLWTIVSGPYGRATEKDLKDFVVDENVDEPGAESDGNVHRLLDRELSQNSDGLTQEDRDLLERYAREEGDEVVDVDEEEEEEADVLQDSDSEEENEELQNVHTSSEEEDEWERDIKSKRKARSPALLKSRKRVSRTSSRAAAEELNLPDDSQETSRSVSGESRKRIVIHESDEE